MPLACPSETDKVPTVKLDDSRFFTPDATLFHYSRRQRRGERATRYGWVREGEPWPDFCRRFNQPPTAEPFWSSNTYDGARRFLGSLVVDVQQALPDTCVARMDANTAPVPFVAFTLTTDEIRVVVPLAKPVSVRSAPVATRRKIAQLVAKWFGMSYGMDMSQSFFTWEFGRPAGDSYFGPKLPAHVVTKTGPLPTWDQLAALTVARKGGAR